MKGKPLSSKSLQTEPMSCLIVELYSVYRGLQVNINKHNKYSEPKAEGHGKVDMEKTCESLKSKKNQRRQMMSGNSHETLKPGTRVLIVQKQDQRSGKVTEGIVETILTKSANHPHGNKVRLVGGLVGRVKQIVP